MGPWTVVALFESSLLLTHDERPCSFLVETSPKDLSGMTGIPALFNEQTNYFRDIYKHKETKDMTTKNFYELPSVIARYKSSDYEKNTAEHSEEMFQEIVSYYINLNRKRRKITQKQIAEALHISQPGVCQMLKRPATIAKLWRLAVAMGGQLEVNIRFGDKVYSLLNEPLDEETEEK